MTNLSIDIETYSSAPLAKCGVYKYAESPDFEILLFGYAVDGGEVQVVDLTAGESIPKEIINALTDASVIKWAYNAQFERICISRFLGLPTGQYLDPASWHCTMVWAATLGLPLSLDTVGSALKLEKQKRDPFVAILTDWLQLLQAALSCRSGLEDISAQATALSRQVSGARLLQSIQALQTAITYVQANVAVAAVCGWLQWALR